MCQTESDRSRSPEKRLNSLVENTLYSHRPLIWDATLPLSNPTWGGVGVGGGYTMHTMGLDPTRPLIWAATLPLYLTLPTGTVAENLSLFQAAEV